MADNRQDFSADGIGRQEEEVRDLFHFLTKNEIEEPKTVSVPQQPAAPMWAVEVPTAQPQAEETAKPDYQDAPAEVAEEEAQPVVAQEPLVEEPQEEPLAIEQQPQEQPSEEKGSQAHAIQETEDEYDEEDMYLELPPLVLTAYDDWDEDEVSDDYVDIRLAVPDEEDTYEVDAAPTVRRNPLLAFWQALRSNAPLPCDSKREIVRKSVFWTSVLVLVFALTYILYSVWWLPAFTKNMYDGVGEDYHPELHGVVEGGVYPQQMQLSFQSLYDRNPETRGWLSFHASGNRDFLNIEYPIMYSGDNDKYLTIDFNGNKNKNGALFFDMRAKLSSAEDENTTLIVYGHNMASGQMLAGLNKFIGNVNNARVAPTLTMNTLFANGQYKVFAVIITDESAQKAHYYNIRRTQFNSDEDFMGHIDNLRARSLFDYPIDVRAGDELLMLSTCTVPSSAKIRDGRLTVVARKVRPDESMTVDTARIMKNDDVIMPYAWYTLQNKQPHAYYASGEIAVPTVTTTRGTSTTLSNDGTLTTIDSSSTQTTEDGNTGTTTAKPHSSGSTTPTAARPTPAPSKSHSSSAPAPSSSMSASASTSTSTSTSTPTSTQTTTSTEAVADDTTTSTEETTTTTTEETSEAEETTTTTVAESE